MSLSIEYLLILDCCQTNEARCRCRPFLRPVSWILVLLLTRTSVSAFLYSLENLTFFMTPHALFLLSKQFPRLYFVLFDMFGCNISQLLLFHRNRGVFNLRQMFTPYKRKDIFKLIFYSKDLKHTLKGDFSLRRCPYV